MTRTIVPLGDRTAGQAVSFMVDAVTTPYDGSNGGLAGFLAASGTSSRLRLNGVTTTPATPGYGRSQPFVFNFSVTPLLTGQQTANVNLTPTCGSFTGEDVSLVVTYTGVAGGGGSTFTAPPTFAENPYTGNGFEPVSTSTGELFGHDERPDLTLGGPLGLTFQRYYASYLAANGVTSAVGVNWMHNFDLKLTVSGTTATVTLFRGKTVRFTRGGTAWTLSSTERVPYQFDGTRFMSPESNLIYTFDADGKLTKVEDRNGNTLTVTQGPNGPTSVADGLGRTLTFSYTATFLTRVTDHAGRQVNFELAGRNLNMVTDPAGRRTMFAYTSNADLAALLTSATLPAGNRPFAHTYDTTGRVATQTDSRANALSLTYTATGATLNEPLGVSFTHAHDGQRNLTAETAGGASSQYTYDASGRPLIVTDRLGNRTTFTYDAASGRPATITDVFGNVNTYTWTAVAQAPFTFYQLTAIRRSDGSIVALAYDAKGNVTGVTDPLGRRSQTTRNARGQVATATGPTGAVTTFTYGNDGSLTSVALDNGAVTSFTYDTAGRVTGVTLPGGATRSYQYDAADNLTRATDERGNNQSAAWDANDNPRTITDALGAVATFGYDGDDRLTSLTDAIGGVERSTYDAVSRLQSVTNAAGNSTTFAYDNLNRPTSAVDAAGKGATFAWDAEARLLSVTDALARATTLTRDRAGRVTTVATPQNERTTLAYDALGRVTSATNPLDETARLQYDAAGRLTAATMPGGVGASYERNELGQVTTTRDPAGNAWTTAFDKSGRRTGSGDPLGRSSTYEYDAAQRLSRIVQPEGSVQFTYDEAGNLTRQTSSEGATASYTYDRNGRLTAADGVALGYDAAGRMTSSNGLQIARDPADRIASVTYASGKAVRYTYDNRGLLSTLADWVGGTTAFAYDDARQLTSMTLPNGVREDYTYDRSGRLASIRASRAGAAVSSIVLRRDAAGRVTGADRAAANVPDPPASYRPMAYDAAHQPVGGSSDPLGRVAADAVRRYTWDGGSRLTSYTGADGAATFTYDAFGMRISRTSGGATQNYVWNYALPLPSVATVRAGTTDQQYFVWLPNGALHSSVAADGTRRFYHFDDAGSTSFLTNDAGAVTDTYAITPFGESVASTGSSANPFTFHGAYGVMQEGITGLYYMRARYYDSVLARFLSPDPIRTGDPRGVNPYQFVYGNPVAGRDPAGTAPEFGPGEGPSFYELWEERAIPDLAVSPGPPGGSNVPPRPRSLPFGSDPGNYGPSRWGDYAGAAVGPSDLTFNIPGTDRLLRFGNSARFGRFASRAAPAFSRPSGEPAGTDLCGLTPVGGPPPPLFNCQDPGLPFPPSQGGFDTGITIPNSNAGLGGPRRGGRVRPPRKGPYVSPFSQFDTGIQIPNTNSGIPPVLPPPLSPYDTGIQIGNDGRIRIWTGLINGPQGGAAPLGK